MKGLLTKEWCLIWKNSISTFILIILFAAIGTFSDMSFMLTYVAIFLSMIPINFMTFDETSKWQQYSLSMPYKRKSIVSAKYVITLIFALFSTIIMAVGLFINMKNHNEFDLETYVIELTVAPVIGILLPSLTFPLNFKFGTGKGRLVMVILICSLAGAIGVLGAISPDTFQNIVQKIFARFDVFELIPIALGGLAVICALSWLISIKVFEHKDL